MQGLIPVLALVAVRATYRHKMDLGGATLLGYYEARNAVYPGEPVPEPVDRPVDKGE